MPERKNINFKAEASTPTQALVMIFDLEGFSKFFAQPDVHQYVPKYINIIFDCMAINIKGGLAWWTAEKFKYKGFKPPVHIKFLGDGALYIWTFKGGMKEFQKTNIMGFANSLWNLKNTFTEVVKKCSDEIPIVDLPKRIRFGLAAGSVYKLTYKKSDQNEYIGYPINLASRLQNYCPELGFIASGRINLPNKTLKESGYIKTIATNLKGFPKEIVIVDKNEYKKLNEKVKNMLFESIQK